MWRHARPAGEYLWPPWGRDVIRITYTGESPRVHPQAFKASFSHVKTGPTAGAGPRARVPCPRPEVYRPRAAERRNGGRPAPAPRFREVPREIPRARAHARKSAPNTKFSPGNGNFPGPLSCSPTKSRRVRREAARNRADTPRAHAGGGHAEAPAGGRRAPGRGRRTGAQPWSIPTKCPSSASMSGADSSSGAVGRTTSSGGLAASSASTSAQVRCSCGTHESRWRL